MKINWTITILIFGGIILLNLLGQLILILINNV